VFREKLATLWRGQSIVINRRSTALAKVPAKRAIRFRLQRGYAPIIRFSGCGIA
jgi:hypothetical protein